MRTRELFGYRTATDPVRKEQLATRYIEQRKLSAYQDGLSKNEVEDMDFSLARRLITTEDIKHYYISAPVVNFSQTIRLKDEINLGWLLRVPNQTAQYSFGNTFIRFIKDGTRITAFAATERQVPQGQYTEFCMFSFRLMWDTINKPDTVFAQASTKLLMQLLSFIELSDVEEVIITPGHKYGNKKSATNLYNEHKFPITIVNSRWTQKIYRPGDILVPLHQRWQPMGPRTDPHYQLIWIQPYTKEGMTITAGRNRRDNK